MFNPGVGKIPWSRKWQPTPVSLPGEFRGQRNLVGCGTWGHKELDMTRRATLSLSHLLVVVVFADAVLLGGGDEG